MKQEYLIKIISIILENDVYGYEELIRLIIELIRAVDKPPEIKTVPEPSPHIMGTPSWDDKFVYCADTDSKLYDLTNRTSSSSTAGVIRKENESNA